MSILLKTKQNLKLKNLIETTGYKEDVNNFIAKYRDELLNLKNVSQLSLTLLEKLAPNWAIIEEVNFLKQKGLEDGKEEDYADLVTKVKDYNELSVEDKVFLIDFVNKHEKSLDILATVDFNRFKLAVEMLNIDEYIRTIDIDYLEGTSLFNLDEDKVVPFLTDLQTIFKKINNASRFSPVLMNINEKNLAYAKLLVDLIPSSENEEEQFIQEHQDTTTLILKALYIGDLLEEMNFENFDKENFFNKVEFLTKNYSHVTDKKLVKFFLPYFKEGKTIDDLNENMLKLLENYKYSDEYSYLLSSNLKKKKFLENLVKFFETDEEGHINRKTSFKLLRELGLIINLNSISEEELKQLFDLYQTFNNYYNSSNFYFDNLDVITDNKGKANDGELLTYIINYKEKDLNKFVLKECQHLKSDTRLSIYKLLGSLNVKESLFRNEMFVSGFQNKLNSFKNPINLIHFYKEYEEKEVSLTKENAFIHTILMETPLSYYLKGNVTNADVQFVMENMKELDSNLTLEENKLKYIRTNENFLEYLLQMNISQEFVEHHQESFLNFINAGNVKTTQAYLNSVRNAKQKENIGLIVKAEIAGKLDTIKYNAEDLKREIGFDISKTMIDKWKSEIVKKAKYTVRESSDFKTLFEMGENPTRSCMSYNGGQYNFCLLSIFDGNKKLITVYDKDKLVGRAILRLTKINENGKTNDNALFGFRDIEAEETTTTKKKKSNDEIVLFLERLYTSYTGKQRTEIEHLIFDLLKEKSDVMNIPLYVSNQYEILKLEKEKFDVKSVETKMFISHSKNGEQYLDSLGGSATNSHGGTFKSSDLIKVNFK